MLYNFTVWGEGVQVRLRTEVLRTTSLTRPGFKLMTSRSWQYILCHWDTCSNHSAITDFLIHNSFFLPFESYIIAISFYNDHVMLLSISTVFSTVFSWLYAVQHCVATCRLHSHFLLFIYQRSVIVYHRILFVTCLLLVHSVLTLFRSRPVAISCAEIHYVCVTFTALALLCLHSHNNIVPSHNTYIWIR